jgi:hypothetical protein
MITQSQLTRALRTYDGQLEVTRVGGEKKILNRFPKLIHCYALYIHVLSDLSCSLDQNTAFTPLYLKTQSNGK